jgi:hypothetical protein
LTGGLKPTSTPIVIKPDQTVKQVPTPGGTVIGRGQPVGKVYRLPSGQLVLVTTKGTPNASSER